MELCIMLLEYCSQERTYLRYYGLLGQRFCMINRVHSVIHRLETNKLRNVAKLFAHLLGKSAIPWHMLTYIRLTEEDTTSSRIFIKILFQGDGPILWKLGATSGIRLRVTLVSCRNTVQATTIPRATLLEEGVIRLNMMKASGSSKEVYWIAAGSSEEAFWIASDPEATTKVLRHSSPIDGDLY